MSDAEVSAEDASTYDTFLMVVRAYVQWASLLCCGIMTLLVFWIAAGTSIGEKKTKSCEDVPLAVDSDGNRVTGFSTLDCNGESLQPGTAWRLYFSLRPRIFVDNFTPLIFGGIETLQHLSPQYRNESISGSWVVRAIWLFTMSLFGQFGYGGNLGVLVGYFTDFGIVLPMIALAVLDNAVDEETNQQFTTAKALPLLDSLLGICGLNALCPGLTSTQRQMSIKPGAPAQVGGSA